MVMVLLSFGTTYLNENITVLMRGILRYIYNNIYRTLYILLFLKNKNSSKLTTPGMWYQI